MIVYSAKKAEFVQDVLQNQIADKIKTSFVREIGHKTSKGEYDSWHYSMTFMNNVINDDDIPPDANIAIEYKIPSTSKRIDFIITGLDSQHSNSAVLVELKQWSSAQLTEMDGIVETYVGGKVGPHEHPSYQAWSYAALLQDFNSNVQENQIMLKPCAYLHNYAPDDVIKNDIYKQYLELAPSFLKNESEKLKEFIKKYIKYGDKNDVMYLIENGKIRPSKQLADCVASMLEGNKEFNLIDDQKIVYEICLEKASKASTEKREVIIVEGGPGTGKSVVAINLLVELTKRQLLAQYVSKNSAPRKVYEAMLSGKMSKTRITNLFTSSGSYISAKNGEFDMLVIDEAHRLNEKSGIYSNLGENQIKELINASKSSVFFIDEDQRVTFNDIGTRAEIEFWATRLKANITLLNLSSQFRCNGSDGYLAWLDNVLQIRNTANQSLDELEYDFRVLDSPSDLHSIIRAKNETNNKSRMVAGYCWSWPSKRDSDQSDIIIGEYSAQWNLEKHGQAWIIQPESVNEVGCIHTCQGLELDYVGVIVGPDLLVRESKVITDASKRASSDRTVAGYKKMLAEHPEQAKAVAEMVIKNTYRTLMTRGMKGCYIYCTDKETQEYFKMLVAPGYGRSLFEEVTLGVSLVD